MAFDAYVKFDGIPGESSDDKHKDWIEILSVNHGVHQLASSTASSAGGGTIEGASLRHLSFAHLVDKATPKLFEACCSGKHFKEVIFELCRAGNGTGKQKYLEIKLEEVIIADVDVGGADGHFPRANVVLNYGRIKLTYLHQKRSDGTGGGQISGGWDLIKRKITA